MISENPPRLLSSEPTRPYCWSEKRQAGSGNRCICGKSAGGKRALLLRLTSAEERENGDFVRTLVLDGIATAAHDISDGGLLVAIAEMAMASGIGAELSAAPSDIPSHAHWFGEDQARYVVTVPAASAETVLARARTVSVPVWTIGKTGGDALTLAGERPILVTILRKRFESWLPAYMAGEL